MSYPYMPPIPKKDFKKLGRNVQISQDAMILGHENIEIGDNVRIDAGVKILALKGHLKLGSHIHIACGVTFVCGGGIEIGDFCPISFNSMLIAASDDFGGGALVGPVFGPEYVNVKSAPIILKRLSAIGSGALVLPGCVLEEGAVLGAMSQMRPGQILPEFAIAFGSPAAVKRQRSTHIQVLANKFEREFYGLPEDTPQD